MDYSSLLKDVLIIINIRTKHLKMMINYYQDQSVNKLLITNDLEVKSDITSEITSYGFLLIYLSEGTAILISPRGDL